jgi:hypothetical protein
VSQPQAYICHCFQAALPEDVRCVRTPAAQPLVQSPGGLNAMFESIVASERLTAMYNTTVMSREPWILQFDNFAKPDDWGVSGAVLR